MIFYAAALLCFVAFCVYQCYGRRKALPPGSKKILTEKGLPIIGAVNKIEGSLFNYLVKLAEKHGPIYSIKIGMRDIVVLNTFDYIKTAMVNHGDTFSGRWKAQKHILVCDNSGLGFIDGHIWAQQRSFVLKTLKEFGIGKSTSKELVQDECECMLEDLEKSKGTVVDFVTLIPTYTSNIICKFLMKRRFSHGDPDLEIIVQYMKDLITCNDAIANCALMFPFLENNAWLLDAIIWMISRRTMVNNIYMFFDRQIKEHMKNLDFNSEGEDFVDRFLITQHQVKEQNGDVGTFTHSQLLRNLLELLGGGYETTSSTIVWALMFMGMYPEVQDQVHKEIVDKVGTERLPVMSDKVSLNYTQAVMDEVMRLSSILPLSLFHRTLNDVNIKGYFIPKDTVVIPNIFACHLDPNIWEKPSEFYPEHFLSKGVTEYKYRHRDELILFGLGKRQCLGESLGRMEFFIFFTSIVQRFQVRLAKEKTHFDVFSSSDGIVRTCGVDEFIFRKRE